MPDDPPLEDIVFSIEDEAPTISEATPIPPEEAPAIGEVTPILPEDVPAPETLGPYRPQRGGPFSPGRARACTVLIKEAEELEKRVREARSQFLSDFKMEMPQEFACAGVLRSLTMEATRYREMSELVAGQQEPSPSHHSSYQ